MNRADWSRELASALGNSSPSADTVRFIAAWTKCEDTRAKYNPLASSHKTEGDSSFNGVVRNYPDKATGIRMTVETLNGRFPGYAKIREGIVNNNPELALQGLYGSPWGTSGLCVDKKFHSSQDFLTEPLPSFPTGDELADKAENYWKDHPADDIENNTIYDTVDNAITDATSYQRRLIYIVAGTVLSGIGIILAIKSLVPTQQIVKTVAEAAI